MTNVPLSAAAVLLAIYTAQPTTAAEVRLRSSVVCFAPIVRLGDIAEICADDAAAAEALAAVALCPSPPNGSERTFSQHELRQLLALCGVDARELTVTGSERVTVLAGQSPASDRRTITAREPVRPALFIAAARSHENRPTPAPMPINVTAPPNKSPSNPLVERGATVTVHARRPGVQITTSGKALQAATRDEVISVELADTRQRVLARVVGPQTVEVTAAGPPAASSPGMAAAPAASISGPNP